VKFVIAGTGRSGTKWCATVLRVGGVYCGHEQVYPTKTLIEPRSIVWGDYEGDASLAAVPFLAEADAWRVLVVRHPLDVAASIVRTGGFLAGNQPSALLHYVRRHHPQVFDQPDELSAAVAYWTAWNIHAEPHADRIVLLEDLTVPAVFDAVRLAPRWQRFPLGAVNTGPSGVRPQWDDIEPAVRDTAQQVASRFGY